LRAPRAGAAFLTDVSKSREKNMTETKRDHPQSATLQRKLAIMRRSDTGSATTHSIGGVLKTRGPRVRPITLAGVKELARLKPAE
jgi:hypothetical protein